MHILGMIGAQEIILILLVVLILFGGKKIPELMRGLGKGVREYKDAMNDVKETMDADAPKKGHTDDKKEE